MNFLHTFSENAQISNFMIIRTVGTELFHADGQKDRQVGRRIELTKLVSLFAILGTRLKPSGYILVKGALAVCFANHAEQK